MENTGRILRGLTPTARRILFGLSADAAIDAELEIASQVDMAHLVMLAERGIVERSHACMLSRLIDELRHCNFTHLRDRSAPRGLYLLYENYLIETLGPQTGGILQTARSRNDLNVTVLLMRLRMPLQAVLVRRARQFSNVVMPIYTHYQAAVPITYGHYLAGIAVAVERDIESIFHTERLLARCPLGAGSVGGTSLPISQARTAQLLGFQEAASHSIDSVASRDVALRLLASITILGVSLSRLSADLLLWTTAEFDFLSLPDELVGSSSMMPQKRNPFILEHVQGKSSSALGAFVAAVMAMHNTPFSNSIAVGTEAVSHIWKALQSITEAITLARLVVDGCRPRPQSMLKVAVERYTSATELANRLMIEGGMAFRAAHHIVGTIIRKAIEKDGEPLQEAAARELKERQQTVSVEGLDPDSVVQSSIYGGGPGAESLACCLRSLQDGWATQMRRKLNQAQEWRAAAAVLDDAVKQLCA